MEYTREVLQSLADAPIGARHLQEEADRKSHTKEKPSAELKEAVQRTSKIWLPEGKRTVPRHEALAAEKAFYARQNDIEAAIEAAGGSRGAHGRA